jgi:hypothetical protein
MRSVVGVFSRTVGWKACQVVISVVAAGSVAVAIPLLASASSAQRWAWSRPVAVDRTGANPLLGLSCPSSDQCTTVDNVGQEVTFDPHSPGHTWRHMLDARGATVSCPSTRLCVAAVGPGGFSPHRLLAFRPKSGKVIREWRIWQNVIDSVSCPSTSQCTAVGWNRETTWDPQTAGSAAIMTSTQVAGIDGGLSIVTCPVVSRCTALVTGRPLGDEVTFDPTTGLVTLVGVKTIGEYLTGLSCFDSAQCTAIDEFGNEVTFDPEIGQVNAAGTAAIEPAGDGPGGVSCPAANQCTAVDLHGNEVTFDPTSGTVNAAGIQPLHTGQSPDYPVAVDCPASNQCTTVSDTGKEATFTPPAGAASATVIDRGQSLASVSCPSSGRCAAIDATNAFGLDLSTKRTRVGGPLKLGTKLALAVSCSSATQCTAVGYPDHAEVTFNPVTLRVNAAGLRTIDPTGNPLAVSCPTTTKCVAVDFQGNDIVFNPSSGKVLSTGGVLQGPNIGSGFDLSCPSAHQCTVVDASTGASTWAFTFNPGPAGKYVGDRVDLSQRYNMSDVQGIDCPSVTECVVVSGWSTELAFKPIGGRLVGPGLVTVSPKYHEQLHGVSCASTHRCVAIGEGSEAVIFDPTGRRTTLKTMRTIPQAAVLAAVSCAPHGPCVAVDAAGNAFIAAQRKRP